ncbi:hypothetical protein [Burkholderia phage FLC9]|nr:hypothetical protein [Burkholderia phage FLC9]
MQSFIVEDRLHRSVRAWPIWSEGRDQYLVTELGHEVQVDGVNFDTAPVKNGVTFSLLGISQNEQTVDAKLHNPTDHLSTKATLEYVYIRIGDQILQQRVELPFTRGSHSGYRVMMLDYAFLAELDASTRDHQGVPFRLLDPFLSAGLKIQITLDLRSTINLELADTTLGGRVQGVHTRFPAHKSLQDHGIQTSIHEDIEKITNNVEVLGFTLDIDRMNMLNPEYRSPSSKRTPDLDLAAAALAARYGYSA